MRAEASVRVPLAYPQPGWVESDPRVLWDTVEAAVAACLSAVTDQILAVAVTNQRESVLAWNRRTGEAIGPCITWQCRRTTPLCDTLRDAGRESWLRDRTGLGIDPLFSASKARWLLDHVEGARDLARRGELCLGTVDSWLVWNLSGGQTHATDVTNASRTQLFNLNALQWDEELLDLFGVPLGALPTIRGSSALYGVTRKRGPLPAGLPIAGVIGDSHGALFGHGAPMVGAIKATYGTGTSVMAPVPRAVRVDGLSTTVAWSLERGGSDRQIDVVFALEGNVTATGAALEWVASVLGLPGREGDLEPLARSVDHAAGVYLVPAFAGLGAPHWDADARGMLSGLTRGTSAAHIARAAFDSIAYQVRDVVDVLVPNLPSGPTALFADGGAMRGDLLGHLQADVLKLPVMRTHAANLAALGAAYLAGIEVGLWGLDDIRTLRRAFDRIDPAGNDEAIDAGYAGWRAALARATFRPEARAARVGGEV